MALNIGDAQQEAYAEPAKAAPELARLAERYEGTPEGKWARDELAEVKRGMAEAEEA